MMALFKLIFSMYHTHQGKMLLLSLNQVIAFFKTIFSKELTDKPKMTTSTLLVEAWIYYGGGIGQPFFFSMGPWNAL